MTTLADKTITALRTEHDLLAAIVPTLSDEALTGPSAATEWTIADVLSHLGSGAEIMLTSLRASLGEPVPGGGFNQSVWDRWNALSPAEQASGFLVVDATLVDWLEALDDHQRASLEVPIGFLPEPLSIASAGAMRLNEAALHGWDVRVAVGDADASQGVDDSSASLLLEHFSGSLGFLLGFIAKPDAVQDRIVLDLGGSGYRLLVEDTVRLTTADTAATATFSGPLESAVRLMGGRLTADRTPAGVDVTGNATLDDLRRVFPGF